MKCPKCERVFSIPVLESFHLNDFSYVAYRCPNPDCQTVINIETDKGEMENIIVAKIARLLDK